MGSYKEEASSLGGWEGHRTNNEEKKKKSGWILLSLISDPGDADLPWFTY